MTARIEHCLATHWMGVLCTIARSGPIGSPDEYYADGMAVYILPQPGSPKLRALQADPRLCFAVHDARRPSLLRLTARVSGSGWRRESGKNYKKNKP